MEGCWFCALLFAESVMEPYLRFLYTYVSVSGPHLGYLYSSNSLFNSGLWLLKKIKGTQCIHQLTFTDDPDLQNTFLYGLCKVMILIDSMLWSFLCLWTLFSFSLFQWKFSSYFPFLMGWKKPLFVVTEYISSMFISLLSAKDLGELQEHYSLIFTAGII